MKELAIARTPRRGDVNVYTHAMDEGRLDSCREQRAEGELVEA
jgi:hypothetical protein